MTGGRITGAAQMDGAILVVASTDGLQSGEGITGRGAVAIGRAGEVGRRLI